MEKESAADIMLGFLKSAANGGSIAEHLAELQTKLDQIIKEKEQMIMFERQSAHNLLQAQELERSAGVQLAEMEYKQKKHAEALEDFDLEKFKVKKDKEAAEALARETSEKIGEADAKLKRLEFESLNLKSLEAAAVANKKKLDEAIQQIKKAIEGL